MHCWKRSSFSGPHYKHKAAHCHARNVKFAVISCFITPNQKHVVGEWLQRWLTWSITIRTRLRPGLQEVGETLVYSKQYTSHQRRQLLLPFHPSDQHSCVKSHVHLMHSTANSLGFFFLFFSGDLPLDIHHFISCLHFYCTVLVFHASPISAAVHSILFFPHHSNLSSFE